jgi:hypothetical protein
MAPSGAGAAITAARQAFGQATTANGYIGRVNSDVVAAYSAANGVASGPCAGDGPGRPPSPVKHIG